MAQLVTTQFQQPAPRTAPQPNLQGAKHGRKVPIQTATPFTTVFPLRLALIVQQPNRVLVRPILQRRVPTEILITTAFQQQAPQTAPQRSLNVKRGRKAPIAGVIRFITTSRLCLVQAACWLRAEAAATNILTRMTRMAQHGIIIRQL